MRMSRIKISIQHRNWVKEVVFKHALRAAAIHYLPVLQLWMTPSMALLEVDSRRDLPDEHHLKSITESRKRDH